MENKQMIHIASEIVVIVGLTFYFNQQNKKLKGHIEDLAQRVEEQEDLLQKHEGIIRKLVEYINQQQEVTPTPDPAPQQTPPQRHVRWSPPNATTKPRRCRSVRGPPPHHTKPPLSPPSPVPETPKPHVSFDECPPDNLQIVEVINSDSTESDIDAELAEELGELDEDLE